MSDILSVEGLAAGYARRMVIDDVSLRVGEGEIVALIGHNGGGKSTTLKATVGVLAAHRGRVVFDGQDVTKVSAAKRVLQGLCLVPQTGNTFPDLTIEENLDLSARVYSRSAAERKAVLDDVLAVFPILEERLKQRAGLLSGGQRQQLALSLALLKRPKILMLDEPSLGLSPLLAKRLLDTVVNIRDERGTSVLIVEQNIREVLRIADRGYVMQSGRIILEAPSDEILEREDMFSLL
jgi:branched-chain amino acid transport system ATP-binding protein